MADVRDRTKSWSAGRAPHQTSRKKQETLTLGERRRLTQLVVCLLIFGFVFIGRGAPEGRLSALGNTLSEWVHKDTDFRAAFSKVGQSVSEGEPFVETFGVLWSGVFGSDEPVQGEGDGSATPPTGEGGGTEPELQTPPPNQAEGSQTTTEPSGTDVGAAPQAPLAPTETPKPAADTCLTGGEEVAPVMGVLTSGFGFRTHPIDGEWKQHDGIDIMAEVGTPIRAFAAGEVDYIGESPAYGLYLQLRHSNGVSSFYAHCSELLVKPGQKVKAGDTVAKVGETGNVTGAHLHLEIKKDGKRVDPALYVKTAPQ